MRKILSSLFVLAVVAVAITGGTVSYFSDTETSLDNTFVAGTIDLKVANTGYYSNNEGLLNPDTTWTLTDLTDEVFFNFDDVKPGDWGINTTALSFSSNPAYLCANITLTESAENTYLEPESEDGDETEAGQWAGELDQELRFFAWLDNDGDNVYETDETIIFNGLVSDLPQGDVNAGYTFALADSATNLYGTLGEALAPDVSYHIGHGWCYGDINVYGATPGAGDPNDDPGFSCDGSSTTNIAQSDSVMGDISFYAVQSRNNTDFVCSDWNPNASEVSNE